MKNLKRIFLAIVLAGAIYSCEDAYNIRQEGELPENRAILTVEDMQLAMTEAYDYVAVENIIAFTSYFTDETAIGIENGGQSLDEYRFQLFASNSYASAIWLDNYALIDRANRIIRAGNETVAINPTDEDAADQEAERVALIAEARLMRAFGHFQLMTFYSTDLKNDSALGVILMDHVASEAPFFEELPRSTNGVLYDFINDDIEYAKANMNANSAAFMSPRFAVALQARIALYRGRYQEAVDRVTDALNAGPGLTSLADYPKLFNPASNGGTQLVGENIFVLQRPLNKTAIVANWFFNEANFSGGPFMEVSRSLYDALRATSGDVRTNVIVGPSSTPVENYETVFNYREEDVLIINKYPGNTARNLPQNNDVSVFRVSELYLIRAEALIHLGQRLQARTTLNQLRAQRISGLSSLPISQFVDDQSAFRAVLDERRKELAFEGHRYVDLKRLGTLAGVNGVQRYVRDCAPYGACELSVTDHRFTLPIPTDEFNGNAVIRSQQNPGY